MKNFLSENKEWSKITDLAYSICEKNGIEFRTNISEYCMWIRPSDNSERVHQQITDVLKEYEKRRMIEIKKPDKDLEESTIEIIRK